MATTLSPRAVKVSFTSLFLIVLAEPISSTILLPFVVFMVRDFGYAEKDVGAHAGFITSAFFVAQIFATPLWCLLSDRVGRKTVLLSGLLGSAFGMVLFGLSRNLWWAIISRCFCGAVNGNFAVARVMVVELATQNNVSTAKAFSLFGFCLAAGWMVGPVLGGALANPYLEHGWAGPWSLWRDWPYLLPCSLSAIYNLLSCMQGFFFLPETRVAVPTPAQPENGTPGQETDPLLRKGPPRAMNGDTPHVESLGADSEPIAPKQKSMRKAQIACIGSAIFFFFHAIMFDELFPLFAAASSSEGEGLSFNSGQIATALFSAGPAMLIALFLYPTLSSKTTVLSLWRWSALLLTFVYLAVPFLSLPALWLKTARWPLLIASLAIRYAALNTGLTSGNIMLNMVATDADRALINGIGQSAGSLARAIGPTLAGCTWSWSLQSGIGAPADHYVTFILIAALCAMQILTSFFIRGVPGA